MPKKKADLEATENQAMAVTTEMEEQEHPALPTEAEPDAAEIPQGFDEEATRPEILSLDIQPLEPEEASAPEDAMDAELTLGLSPVSEVPLEPPEEPPEQPEQAAARPQTDRQNFYDLDFNELDRGLTAEARQEWNSIYASYRGRSALTGIVSGVDRHTASVRDPQSGELRQEEMYCAIVVPYRVRIVIPAAEMWEQAQARPSFVLQNMVGAAIDFIIIRVDREGGFAIASRRLAARARRYYFSRRPALHKIGAKITCRVLAVGPRRCLVECFGHDVNLTQRELRYSAIPDLRGEYHPGQELDCVVKQYDPEPDKLEISVKETSTNPFDGASERHPVGCRRQAAISGKYGGGVFCNLSDGTVCMCSYSYQYDDAEFGIGDSVILVIQRYDMAKKQTYGKIITKW